MCGGREETIIARLSTGGEGLSILYTWIHIRLTRVDIKNSSILAILQRGSVPLTSSLDPISSALGFLCRDL